VHGFIVIKRLKDPLCIKQTVTPTAHAILARNNHNKHATTRTKANHGETSEGGINVMTKEA